MTTPPVVNPATTIHSFIHRFHHAATTARANSHKTQAKLLAALRPAISISVAYTNENTTPLAGVVPDKAQEPVNAGGFCMERMKAYEKGWFTQGTERVSGGLANPRGTSPSPLQRECMHCCGARRGRAHGKERSRTERLKGRHATQQPLSFDEFMERSRARSFSQALDLGDCTKRTVPDVAGEVPASVRKPSRTRVPRTIVGRKSPDDDARTKDERQADALGHVVLEMEDRHQDEGGLCFSPKGAEKCVCFISPEERRCLNDSWENGNTYLATAADSGCCPHGAGCDG